MIVPDEEQAWIAKYREAMDARRVGESRTSRIRAVWSHLTFAAVSATQTIAHRARRLIANEPPPWPSTLVAAETVESTIPSSEFENTQSGGASTEEGPEHGAAVSITDKSEVDSGFSFISAANELIHLK
jgi:hypothetical protein